VGFLIFRGMEMLDHRIAYWKNEAGMKRVSAKRARSMAAAVGG
jgi:hypothetical protein